MNGIIDPIDKELLKEELVVSKFMRETNKGKNHIFILDAHNSPNVMLEIGRLREITFRVAGGGTGKEVDIDEFDHGHFKQLIVWDPENEEIVGGYRFAFMKDLISKNGIHSPANEIFDFSEVFIKEFAPFTIELGRSFVQPNYQPKRDSMKGIFSLDNLWDGLASLMVDYPKMKYFFGKMTMYKDYNRQARNLILYFLSKHFPDKDKLVFPKSEFELDDVEREIHLLDGIFVANSYKEDKYILQRALAEIKENIPPLFNAYMETSPDMKVFGTADNPFFGGVEETGILVTMNSIYPKKKDRHVKGYKPKTRI
ncbi:GNAT family N-acetyltransferase [Candidatus Gracilibacteria bacterium]|nr:GNAT family N-acetyltransferase [Candidatus Gracilibacteria bacterium]